MIMMKRFVSYLILSMLVFFPAILSAQSYAGVEKFPLKCGLMKIKNGDYYGIYDANDKVVVSVEYQDIVFVEGIAVLTKREGTVHGYITEDGKVKMFDEAYEYHPHFPFFSNGYLPVRKIIKTRVEFDASGEGRWMFIDESGSPICNPLLPNKNLKVRLPYKFSSVNAFSCGYAVVTGKRDQIIHIDITGNKRFTLPKEEVCYFRSSVKDGECVIVTGSGVKVYQENPDNKAAVVKQVISSVAPKFAAPIYDLQDSVRFVDACLYLDDLGCPVKYVPNKGEPLYFAGYEPQVIETVPLVQEEVKFNLFEDLDVQLRNKVATASEHGTAAYSILVTNNSDVSSVTLVVKIKSSGMKDVVKEIDLNKGVTKTVKFDIPAKFTEEKQYRKVTVTVSNKDGNIEKSFTVTVKRRPLGEEF